ncbi:cardiolipin synthase [Leifsonia flava]|uniref:Cardiolipin synthase n=1 Tax=Orlajensenia leifsoniae TaxID=2561933 RepID=A0A4Y9R7I3_9MICO|nr:cardiolipin synthase [Leifsonia flava]TFW00208.1 cardiolipin synthase [Leifsonia flava]
MSSTDLSLLVIALLLIIDWSIRIAAIIIIPRNRRPTAATAWLLAVFFIPYIGVLLFLLIGNPKLPRKRRAKQKEMDAFIRANTDVPEGRQANEQWPAWFGSIVELNSNLSAMPMVDGNSARLIASYQGSIDAMTAEIATARKYVHVEFYILSCDQTTAGFFDALEAAVGRGVKVRVLLDHWASSHTRDYKSTLKRLTAMGAEWYLMLPVQPLKGNNQRLDLRNHRKILVVDGRTAFVGSQNLIDRTYNKKSNIKRGLKWQELVARVDGPVVDALNLIFITDWFIESDVLLEKEAEVLESIDDPRLLECQVVPSGPGFAGENNLRLFLALLYNAQERIVITSPYFVPDEAMLYAITTAVQRGVAVDLFVSEIGDQALVWHAQRSYYEALLRNGVRIYMYKAPYILHAKHFTVDEDVAVIGSSNMDMRSFGLNMEVSLMVRGKSFVQEMRAVEDDYRAASKELTLEDWMKQPLRSTVLDNLARLTSALQ